MTLRHLTWFSLFMALAVPTAWGQGPITVQAESCFSGMSPHGTFPIAVSIENRGPSVEGALLLTVDSVSESERQYVYPVSLPTGTNKKILAYPAVSPYAQNLTVQFSGPGGTRPSKVPFESRFEQESQQVGLIGDLAGGLAALRSTGEQSSPPKPSSPQVNDCYSRPENAPDRAVGYAGLSALVLTDGAERMNPAQWTAIRHWVLGGGSLILLGGAGAAYARVPEAAPLLPLQNLAVAQVSTLHLEGMGSLPPGDIALLSGAPQPGTAVLAEQGGHILLASRPLGAGTVLFVAFDPLEKTFRNGSGQKTLWKGLIARALPTVTSASLQTLIEQRQSTFGQDDEEGTGSGVNPFRIRLPPLGTVAWIFFLYFILVVPVTYLVLKRLRRMEWAWVTSPLLSIACAYAFYLFTANLYLAGLSRRTGGILVAAAGANDARFLGFSELFFPHGGSYTIEVPGAETMELTNPEDYQSYGGGSDEQQTLETVDTGTVTAPDLGVANLAFRRIYHTEPVTWGSGISATLRLERSRCTGTVHNGTGQALLNARMVLPGGIIQDLGDLAAGQTSSPGKTGQSGSEDLVARVVDAQRKSQGATAILVAETKGETFGPPLGKDVGGDRSVSVLVSLPLSGGGR